MSEIQLSTLRTEFGYLKQDISDVSEAVFVSWCNRVMNFIWRKLRAVDSARFLQTQSYTVSSDPQTSSLPSDFSKMDVIGCGLFLVEDNGAGKDTNIKLARTEFGSSRVGYYLDGDNIVFTGINSDTYKLKYLPKQPRFTTETDYFTLDKLTGGTIIVDDEFTEYLVDALDVKYSQWDNDVVEEGNADQRFANVLSEIVNEYKRDSKAVSLANPVNTY